ncbi:MAG: poly-gamma-glutamate biosynthesis protein PgsC [Candidatus Thermoplasmatota archaeon]
MPWGLDDTTIRIGIVVGIVVSMIWYEKRNLSPGGVIVPGLFALYLFINPILILFSLLISVGTVLIVKKISNYVILFGRRRFSALMLISFGLAWLCEVSTQTTNMGIEFRVIGFIIPGLIANEMERQGYLNTLQSLSIITIITCILIFVLIGFGGV